MILICILPNAAITFRIYWIKLATAQEEFLPQGRCNIPALPPLQLFDLFFLFYFHFISILFPFFVVSIQVNAKRSTSLFHFIVVINLSTVFLVSIPLGFNSALSARGLQIDRSFRLDYAGFTWIYSKIFYKSIIWKIPIISSSSFSIKSENNKLSKPVSKSDSWQCQLVTHGN